MGKPRAFTMGPQSLYSTVEYKVVYPYEAQLPDELTTKPGDVIQVSSLLQPTAKGSKWITGELQGKTGLFYLPFVVRSAAAPPVPAHRRKAVGFEITCAEYAYQAKEKPGDDLECIICKNLSRDPHQSKCCGHTMCHSCADTWKRRNNTCPNCRESPFLTVEDPRTKRYITGLSVYCPYYTSGCNWEGSLSSAKAHLTEKCAHAMITCTNEGCGAMLHREDLLQHQQEECYQRHLPCPCCSMHGRPIEGLGIQEPLTYAYIITQHYPKCPAWPMRCPNNMFCFVDDLTRGTLQDHIDNNCPEQVISCQFAEAGCTVRVKRKEMADHIQQSTKAHLLTLLADYVRVKKEHAESICKLTALTSDYTDLKRQHAESLDQLTTLSSTCAEIKREHSQAVDLLTSLSNAYAVMKAEHDDMKAKMAELT